MQPKLILRVNKYVSSYLHIAVLKQVRYALCPMPYALCPMHVSTYSGSQASEVCPMPYALCPMPYARRVPHVTEKGYSAAR
jgi:hypothetical protein